MFDLKMPEALRVVTECENTSNDRKGRRKFGQFLKLIDFSWMLNEYLQKQIAVSQLGMVSEYKQKFDSLDDEKRYNLLEMVRRMRKSKDLAPQSGSY